jgi:hypothetical protein
VHHCTHRERKREREKERERDREIERKRDSLQTKIDYRQKVVKNVLETLLYNRQIASFSLLKTDLVKFIISDCIIFQFFLCLIS